MPDPGLEGLHKRMSVLMLNGRASPVFQKCDRVKTPGKTEPASKALPGRPVSKEVDRLFLLLALDQRGQRFLRAGRILLVTASAPLKNRDGGRGC